MFDFADPLFVCRAVCLLYGLSVGSTFSEKLAIASDYGVNGWFDWTIFQVDRSHIALFRKATPVTGFAFGAAGMTLAFALGLAGVLLMWANPARTLPFTAGVAITVMASLLVQARGCYGGDGAHQMNIIIGVAVLLGFNPFVSPAVGHWSLVFIAAQSALAYLASGVAKLVSPIWRKGDALAGILATVAYGSSGAYRLTERAPRLSRWVCRFTVLCESAFPVALAAPRPVLFAFLAWGAAFHAVNAVVMGLNTFLWSFVATYPAILYVWQSLHRAA